MTTSRLRMALALVLAAWASAEPVLGGCPSNLEITASGLHVARGATFRVLVEPPQGGRQMIGTATVIHPAGYLITASHIFEPAKVRAWFGNAGIRPGARVWLHRPKFEKEPIPGRVFAMRDNETTAPDLAIIRLDTVPKATAIVADISLGLVATPTGRLEPILDTTHSLTAVSYARDLGLDDQRVLRATPSIFRQGNRPIIRLSIEDRQLGFFPRESGASVFGTDGVSIGVLLGFSEDEDMEQVGTRRVDHYRFTPAAYIAETKWLTLLPRTDRVERIIAAFRQKASLPIEAQEDIRSLSQLELWQLSNSVATSTAGEFPGLDLWAYQSIHARLVECRMFPTARTWVTRVGEPQFPDSHPQSALDLGRAMLSEFDRLPEQRRIQSPELVAALLDQSLVSFREFRIARARSAAPDRFALAYFDHARAAHEAAKRAPPETAKSLRAEALLLASRSSTLNPTSTRTWELKSLIALESSDLDGAIRFSEIALQSTPSVDLATRLKKDHAYLKSIRASQASRIGQ